MFSRSCGFWIQATHTLGRPSGVGLNTAIVGGGYAGMAAAVTLSAAGHAVTVFEASRVLGGRARASDIEGQSLDNGQHLLIGAYRDTLSLMRQIGADPEHVLRRLPLRLDYPGRMRLAAPHLPAPLHLAVALVGAKGLSLGDRWAAIRLMRHLKQRNFQIGPDQTLADWLQQERQPDTLRRYLWEPLCIAALNTPVESASAQTFVNVLRDSLCGKAADSDMLLPLTDLSRLFPEPAATYVAAHGGTIIRGERIGRIERCTSTYRLDAHGPFDHVIAAVAPHHLSRLIEGLPDLDALRAQVDAFGYEPIVTAYLSYPESVRLPQPMLGFVEGHLQWLFDRGQLGNQPGLLAAVISARGRHRELDNDTLLKALHAEIGQLIPDLPPPRWGRVIVEKRATFSCTPHLPRPDTTTALPGLLLAGDYLAGDYPATLESAVRSGVAAATRIIDSLKSSATH